MKKKLYKKGLVLGIIVLFIVVSFAPSINANVSRLTVKSKLVETSVRIHRARGIIPYTLKLSEKESDEIDRIFDNIKVCLDSAVTDDEIDEIYDDAVVSLYELGLFPKMSFDEAKQLVRGKSVKSSLENMGTADENFNCQIAGTASRCFIFKLGWLFQGGLLYNLIQYLIRYLGELWSWREYNLPYFEGRIGEISFGSGIWMYPSYFPSRGWVWTNGTNGVVEWEGEFYGNIDEHMVWEDHVGDVKEYVYIGVNEFEGLWIDERGKHPWFLGNAEHVSITYDEP
jgi:hypothetical protein